MRVARYIIGLVALASFGIITVLGWGQVNADISYSQYCQQDETQCPHQPCEDYYCAGPLLNPGICMGPDLQDCLYDNKGNCGWRMDCSTNDFYEIPAQKCGETTPACMSVGG